MLNGIHLVDYGNHRDTRLTFGRMTALVGQNGAGKTNALKAILEMAERYKNEGQDPNGTFEVLRKASKEWMLEANWPGSLLKQIGTWFMQVGSQKSTEWLWRESAKSNEIVWEPGSEDWLKAPVWGEEDTWDIDVSGEVEPGMVVRPFNKRAPRGAWTSRYFKTTGAFLRDASYSESVPPSLGEDCRGLAWMIAYLKGNEDDIFGEITKALHEIVPTFCRVRHRPAPMRLLEKKEIVINKQSRSYDEEQQVMGQELRFDMASGKNLPATAISEGTLVSLAVLTAVIHEGNGSNPQTILLDDVESGLHPSAQRDLIRQLKQVQEKRPELQIIFSSHSPYIIDEMQPEDVWLFAPDKEGIAHCAKLSDHPDAKRALEVLTTGEFWSAEGESWVLDRAQRTNEEAVAAK